MTQKTKRNQAFRKVLGFTARHWRKQPVRIATIVGLFFIETITDILTPFFAGRLVEAVASGAALSEIAWNAAITAFLAIVALGAASVLVRLFAFRAIIQPTLRMMSDIAQQAFHRVQRFSSDWHANSVAGSTVRKITRGMWALDSLNDVILMALFSSVGDAGGHQRHAGHFLADHRHHGGHGSVIYIAVSAALSTFWVALASSLPPVGHARRRRARRCGVVQRGGEGLLARADREEVRLAHAVDKWRSRHVAHLEPRHAERHHPAGHAVGYCAP